MPPGNCPIFEEVDFGEGPVRIRCTQIGTHAEHRTEVFFRGSNMADQMEKLKPHNVFEQLD